MAEFDAQFRMQPRDFIAGLDFYTWTRHFHVLHDLLAREHGDVIDRRELGHVADSEHDRRPLGGAVSTATSAAVALEGTLGDADRKPFVLSGVEKLSKSGV